MQMRTIWIMMVTNEGYAGNDGQQFGLSNGLNHGLNQTNEGEAGRDLSDFIEDLIDNMDESGPVNGSDSDNTNAASTAAGDHFDSSFANEAADKDQRQQEAEERANNQNSQTRRMSKQKNRLLEYC
jgi:hypothetical protein